MKLAKKFNSTSFNLKQEVSTRRDEERPEEGLHTFVGGWLICDQCHVWSVEVVGIKPDTCVNRCGNTVTRVRLNCNNFHTPHIGVKISLCSSSLIKNRCQVHSPYKYQPSSGLSSSLLMKACCLRLKLVELNFFASFNADDQRKTYVSNVSKYIFLKRILSKAQENELKTN